MGIFDVIRGGVTAAAKRGLSRMFVPSILRATTGVIDALEQLERALEAKPDPRTESLVRTMADQFSKEDLIIKIRGETPIPRNLMSESKREYTVNRYTYRMEWTERDQKTGEMERRYGYVGSTRPMSKEAATEHFDATIGFQRRTQYKVDVSDVQILGVIHRAGDIY